MVSPPDIHLCPRQSYGRSLYGKDSRVAEQWHPTPIQRQKDRRMLQVLHKRIPPASIRIVGFYRTIDYENKINFKSISVVQSNNCALSTFFLLIYCNGDVPIFSEKTNQISFGNTSHFRQIININLLTICECIYSCTRLIRSSDVHKCGDA